MITINQIITSTFQVVERQVLEARGTQTTNIALDPTPSSQTTLPPTSATPSPSATPTMSTQGGGGTSSPLLFFVALGFGVVFTNLWIIVGVKYCFRYNARNRALRNGEDVDPINLENMPTRPHRRRREKKLMTMDEVNERFPLTKYKNWIAARASEGLPTAGGVNATPSRAASLREADGIVPSSPVGTKHSEGTRPATAASEEITISAATNNLGGSFGDRKSMEATSAEKGAASSEAEEQNPLEQVRTTASTVDKHITTVTEGEEEEDEDDHIHTAVPPELLTNPGDSCAICIDTLEQDDDIRGLTCGHAFHAGCLDPWLTSRRACCPLCKADYYVPKPRPEGEAAETERSGRRGRMPQPPQNAWTGIRGNTRLILPGRFGSSYPGDGYNYGGRGPRSARRARAAAIAAAATEANGGVSGPGAAENSNASSSSRWRPRISNPFSNVHMPNISMPGRARRANAAPEQDASEPSPSQLEAGVVR